MMRFPGKEMNPVLKKLMFKVQTPVLLVNAPAEFKPTAKVFGVPVEVKPTGCYSFAYGFVKSLADADKLAQMMRRILENNAVF